MELREQLLGALEPLARTVSSLDLSASEEATASLEATHPAGSLEPIYSLLRSASDEGWLTPKRATETLTFGRLSKPDPRFENNAVDVVDIEGAGMEHTHPRGEVSLCLALEGEPRFDGHPPGWVVYPPDSHHTPTVTGGRMLIVYFQPEGAVKWGPRQTSAG